MRADVIWNEPFNYADGPIISNSSGLWIRHSGSANPSDSVVMNNRLEVASSNPGAVPRTDDVHRDFTSATNTQTILYASFTVNCTNLPPVVGTYFAHFYVTSTTFHGRVFAQAGTLPNTWRLGIAGAAGTVSAVFPVDLAANTDYQVVVRWDPVTSFSAQLWVNPLAETDTFAKSTDAVSAPAAPLGYAFRQGGSFGNAFFDIDNLVVATLFDEALTNLLSTNAVAPAIVYQPIGGTNFVGDNITLTAVAAGQGLASLTYQWQKNSSDIGNPNGDANVFSLPSAAATDSGDYQLIVTTPFGLSATSSVATLWVTNPPVPPTITQQPTNEAIYYGQTATLFCGATGPGTLFYTWYHDNNSVASEGNPNVSGDGTPTLTVANVQTNNGTAGTYRCDVANIFGTTPSSNAVVSAISVPVVPIYYLRGLVDPTFYLPTNTTALWSATGIVTVYTNLTAAPNLSIMIQDATAGIGVFMSGAAASLPQAGDSVTVVGSLGNFNSALQINVKPADPSNQLIVNSHNNPLPTPYVLPLSFTNGIAFDGVSNVVRKYVSALVTFNSVYFTDLSDTFPTGQLTETITNTSGDSFRVFFNAAVTPVVAGQPIPRGAVSVTGPMSYFLSTTATDRSAGFEIDLTRYQDIVVTPPTPPLPVTINNITATALSYAGGSGAQFVLLQSPDVNQPLGSWTRTATNNATPGSFPIATGEARRFYRITSE